MHMYILNLFEIINKTVCAKNISFQKVVYISRITARRLFRNESYIDLSRCSFRL